MSSFSGSTRAAPTAPANQSFPLQKGRHYFQKAQPTFSVSPGYTQLEFVDNSDPRKDAVVRKKAREWVFRNREVTKAKRGVTFKQHEPKREKVEQRKGNRKKHTETTVTLFDPSPARIDPFDSLPNVGLKVDHIIDFYHHTSHLRLHFLTSSIVVAPRREEVTKSDDKNTGRTRALTTRASNENTILGSMARERISYILWLHATALVKDCIMGSSESVFFYRLALQAMQEEVERGNGRFSEGFLVALACFAACANFSGEYNAARLHRDALIKALTLRGNGDLKTGIRSCTPWCQKAIVWCEVHVAAQIPSLPMLPFTPPPSKDIIPETISHQAAHLTAVTMSHIPLLSESFEPLILHMHQLCLLQDPPDNKTWPGLYKADTKFSVPLYRSEYTVLQLLTAQEQQGHSFTPVEVMFSNACQLFLWPAVRGLSPEMKMCDLFVERLQKATIPLLVSIRRSPTSPNTVGEDVPAISPCYTAPDSQFVNPSCNTTVSSPVPPPIGSVDYLTIWALFLGTLMTTVGGRPQHSWFREQLQWMTLERNAHIFRSAEDFKNVLKLFPYTEAFCGMGVARVGLEFKNP